MKARPYQIECFKFLQKRNGRALNWDIISYWRSFLPYQTTKTIIGDEIHKIGNSQSLRTKAFTWLSKYILYVIGMSATPIRSKPGQFFPLLHILDPETFFSQVIFQSRYCNMKKNDWTGILKEQHGGRNLAELHRIISKYMIRREKRDILKDLPPRERTPILLDINNIKEYNFLEKQIRQNINKNLTGRNSLNILRQTSFTFKRDQILSWIEDFLESEESLIVFAFHKKILNDLERYFKKKCIKIDGSIVGKKRKNAVEAFMRKEKQLMLAQIDAVGEAMDGLQKVCSSCAFVEFGNTAISHEQAEGRIERDGQKSNINCYYLIGKGTFDEVIMSRLDQQLKTIDKTVKGIITGEEDLFSYLYNKWLERK